MATFSRQHYELIARAMASVRPLPSVTLANGGKEIQWGDCVAALSRMFDANNPRFNAATFNTACRDNYPQN